MRVLGVIGGCGRAVAAALIVAGLTGPAWAQEEVGSALKERVRANEAADGALGALAKVYADGGYAPRWVKDGRPTARARALVEALKALDADGLEPEDYEVSSIAGLWSATTAADLARLELMLSRAALMAAADMSAGRVVASALDPNMSPVQRRADHKALAEGALAAADPGAFLASLAPAGRQYPALRKALAEWRERAATTSYSKVPTGGLLKPGMCDPRVPALRKRLSETEANVPPAPAGADPNCYDDGLVAVVKAFQAAHNLSVDGVVGPRATAMLNVPIEAKVQQIIANLERRRWADESPGTRYLLINAADYSARFVDEGRVVFRTKVIVGTAKDPTPEITSEMRSFQTNPYWTVPTSIAGEEYLPALRRDPQALSKSGMRIFADWSSDAEIDPATIDWNSVNPRAFPYRIRQEPGAGNALGYIFFPFSNRYGIYIHDTSSRWLFAEGSRNFSHGCIRLENPVDFVEAVFKGAGGVTKARVQAIAGAGQQANFTFPAPVALHVTYQTVFLDDDGKVQFREDVYGRDRKVHAAMRKARPLPRLS
ncbi:MAG: L,D-transpeptidase family protein [Rhodospirillales bacterium]|nr:L,D-transpeptidase family protein [Rhodospirillales bacterium]